MDFIVSVRDVEIRRERSDAMGKMYCKTCGHIMDEGEFYTSNDISKYPPNGKLKECKKCITRHVDNYDPETFKWILQEIDVPYIESEWSKILNRCAKDDPKKLTGTTVLGRYLSAMKLVQHRKERWADTERIAQQEAEMRAAAMESQGYGSEEIAQVQEAGMIPEKPQELIDYEEQQRQQESSPIDNVDPGIDMDLTEEDIQYLTIKWGKTYKPYEWVKLEKYYQEMMSAFDIVTPAHKDYLELICKTSLKMHQCIDLGDIEGFQKLSRVYTGLMKDAKFTAAQNKAESGEYVSAIDEFILLCEREDAIPRFYTDSPKDKVDETLADLRGYTYRLVTEEMNLGDLIENAVRTMQKEEEKEEDDEVVDNLDIELQDLIDPTPISDDDFSDYNDYIDSQQEQDEAMIEEAKTSTRRKKYGTTRPAKSKSKQQ